MNLLRFRRNPILRFRRIYAGRYQAAGSTTLAKDESVTTIPVLVTIHHVREWGSTPWALEIEGRVEDYALQLTRMDDAPQATKAEAVRAAEDTLTRGFHWYPGLGWALN